MKEALLMICVLEEMAGRNTDTLFSISDKLTIGGFAITLLTILLTYCADRSLQKRNTIYEEKRKVLVESLNFVDDYISWLILDGTKPIRRELTAERMTAVGREIYNKLCLYIKNREVISLFLRIIINPQKEETLLLYNKFRVACRKELGMKKIELSDNEVFFSCIATDDLLRDCSR